MKYTKLNNFREFLEDENYLRLREKLFPKGEEKKFNGNLQVFTLLYYLYIKFDKYKYLFEEEDKAIADFKNIFNKITTARVIKARWDGLLVIIANTELYKFKNLSKNII